MCLINIHTQQLEEFFGNKIPPYYILSHTWENDEISYQDYTWLLNYEAEVDEGIIAELLPRQQARIQAKARSLRDRNGYRKITSFIQTVQGFPRHERPHPQSFNITSFIRPPTDSRPRNIAKLMAVGVDYVWIDTCCINKESSAELSEAINSMYMWYKDATLCLTYLSDVEGAETPLASGYSVPPDFSKSRWFSRGWTLQELIAPRFVLFYNMHWEYITDRSSAAYEIQERTGISSDHFGHKLADRPISERMSWAANRETTRVEDRAYCLMGIFGVNMPLLYGEGERAFHRLQREIANMSADQSLFAWGYGKPPSITGHPSIGMFAEAPTDFSTGGQIVLLDRKAVPFTLNNVGLQILGTLVRPVSGERGWAATFLVLNSLAVRDEPYFDILAIPVQGLRIDTVDLKSIVDGAVIFRAFGHPVRLPGMILSKQGSAVERPVIIAKYDYDDLFVPSADGISSRSLDFITFRVDDATRLDIHETWPHCNIPDHWTGSNRNLKIIIHNQSSVLLRCTDKNDGGNDGIPAKQYVLALCLEPLTGKGCMGIRYTSVFEWKDFARLSAVQDTNSLAGLLCHRPELIDPAQWPPKDKGSSKYRVRVDYLTASSNHIFRACLELETRVRAHPHPWSINQDRENDQETWSTWMAGSSERG